MVVAPRDPRDHVVAGADRLRPRLVLGAPAPGQPLAGRAGAGGGLASTSSSTRPPAPTDELDLTAPVDALAARADAEPATYRWSYTRALGDCTLRRHRLARGPRAAPRRRARCSTPTRCAGSTSVLQRRRAAPVHRHLAALPAAPRACTTSRRWTRRWPRAPTAAPVARAAEKLRRSIDLEHWAAFNEGFDELFELVMQVARGERGPAPQTITFLSGDVHNSYLAEVTDPLRAGRAVAHGAGGVLADPQPDAARRAGGHVAVRAGPWCARCGSSRPARRGCPTRPTRGRSPTGRGSTTTSRWSPCARTRSRSPGSPASSRPTRATRGLQQVYAARLDPLPATVRVGSGSVQG